MVTKQELNCQMFAKIIIPKIHYQFGNQTLEINISVSRYKTEIFLYTKQSYGKYFSKEYGPSFDGLLL